MARLMVPSRGILCNLWLRRYGRAAGVTLAGRSAKSRTGGRKLRSTGTIKPRVGHGRDSTKRLQRQLQAQTRELAEAQRRADEAGRQACEALERQTATGEILSSISGSMTDPKPVFDAIVRNLLRLFGTRFAGVQLLNDGIIEMPAADGAPGFEKILERFPRPLDDTTAAGRTMLARQVVQYSPLRGNPKAPSATRQFAQEFGYDSMIYAPMVRGDKVIGAIGTAHHEPRVFDDREVALIKSFADQAVIAIENVRLFDEVQ